MDYVKAALSGLAAFFVAESVLAWPLFSGSKATGLAAIVGLLVESVFSAKFWIIGILQFALFFAASRGGTLLRVLFFWIPTVAFSALGFAFLGLLAYLALLASRQH